MNDDTQFLEAVKAGDLATVAARLAARPALANARDADGVSAVLLAVYHQEPDVGRMLIRAGAELGIHEAAAAGETARAAALLGAEPALANAVAPDGFTPLGLASFFGHLRIVQLLLTHGAEVNHASENALRVMPLHSAVASRHVAIAETLLAYDAEVNARQAGGFTPLHAAAQNGQLNMVRLLMQYGADPDLAADDGNTAADMATGAGHGEVAMLLRAEGA